MKDDRTPEGEALTALILECFRLNGMLLSEGKRITHPYGMTSARWQVLGAIELAGSALTVSQIARRMGLMRQGVQRIVHDLENMDMVSLLPNPDHKRASLVSTTEKGKVIFAKIEHDQIVWVNQLASGLGEERLRDALTVMKDVRAHSDGVES